MSIQDKRGVKTRGWSRKSRRAYTKNKKYRDRPGNIWRKV